MAIRDLESFIRQIAREWDPSLDISAGSPFDTKVVQRVLTRLGTDPFTVDMATFIQTRLRQAYPDVAFDEGGPLTDLFMKPATLLWDPIVRENTRVAGSLSFANPDALTAEEAESLGANVFSDREKGEYAKGVGRLYFSKPQNIGATPEKFFTCKAGLHFFPQEAQSIRGDEMMLNLDEDGLYYFDVNLIAEAPGSDYNIPPGSLVSVANIPSAVKVDNLKRFQDGLNEETPAEYIYRAQRELAERTLVTLRGIAAKLSKSYPEARRISVVGFNDPEMQRDIIKGGSFGEIVASGVTGIPVPDGDGATKTRRFYTTDVDFTAEVGSVGTVSGYYITIYGATGALDHGTDFALSRIVSANEVEVDEQELSYSADGPCAWSVRRKEITLSDIPGGILFPDSQFGTVSIPPDEIHIGGTTDIYLRGTELEDQTLIISSLVDNEPTASGVAGVEASLKQITLGDYVFGSNYTEDDDLYQDLVAAEQYGYSLHILTGPNAGSYRVIEVTQTLGFSPDVFISPQLPNPPGATVRWRLVDEINVDLVDPRETRIEGSDLSKVQSSNVVTTAGGVDFDSLGVAKDDILRILEGEDEGDYTLIEDPIAPGFTSLRLSADMTFTETGVSYEIFNPNPNGGLLRPLVRISSIELLDSSDQPQGTTVPYAKPVDVQTRAFQNPSRGVKHDWLDVSLGIVSADLSGPFTVTGTLTFLPYNAAPTSVVFAGEATLAAVIAAINTQLEAAYGIKQTCVQLDAGHFGIRPFGYEGRVAIMASTGGVAATLFGTADIRTSCDIRSASAVPSWDDLDPRMDFDSALDVVQVLTGANIGFYQPPYTLDYDPGYSSLAASEALILANGDTQLTDATCFSPERNVRIQIGSRSLGSARMYFLEPTTIEVDPDTYFTAIGDSGAVRFLPDPSLSSQIIPALPGNTPILDGEMLLIGPTAFTSASQDFIESRIVPGDELTVTYWPLAGTISLPDPVQFVAGTTLIYSANSGAERTVTFIRDDPSLSIPLGEVSRDGIIDQINASFGYEVCTLTATNEIEFVADVYLVISGDGTANDKILGDIAGTAPPLSFYSGGPNPLGTDIQRSNRAPYYGTETIDDIPSPTGLSLAAPLPLGPDFAANYPGPIFSRMAYHIDRPGAQRIATTEMASNEAEAGLYYFDVELVSEGTGDLWNIDADLQMTVEGYRSDGWYLLSGNDELTFSLVEEVTLVISRTILPNGVDDDPANAIQMSGQSIQISYERSPTVESVSGYVSSDVERVVCSSPLVRYLVPYFVRFDLSYTGGSTVDVVLPELEEYIQDTYPNDTLQSSGLQKIVLDRGATGITNPLDLIAIVHEVDRSITARRSQDELGTDSRLCTFVPDYLNLVRGVS